MPVDLSRVAVINPAPVNRRPALVAKDVGKCFAVANNFKARLQYASSYFCRLKYLKPVVADSVRVLWGSDIAICNLCEAMGEHASENIVITGVLHKQMKLKPSVLDQTSKALDVPFPKSSFIADDDFAFLEEESGRVELSWGDCDADERRTILGKLVTGIVMAVKGQMLPSGQFRVEEYLLPGSTFDPSIAIDSDALQSIQSSHTAGSSDSSALVAVVSNLKLADASAVKNVRLLKLKAWLGESQGLASRVNRLVVVGNALGRMQPAGNPLGQAVNEQKYQTAEVDLNAIQALKEADQYLKTLTRIVPVDLVVGDEDPSTYALPQLPLPPRLFIEARKCAALQCLPNPGVLDICAGESSLVTKRLTLMGTQSVDDILRYTDFAGPSDALDLCVRSYLLAPTGPDTLSTVPFDTNDLMCLPTPTLGPKGDAQAPTTIAQVKESLERSSVLPESANELGSAVKARFPDVLIAGGFNETRVREYYDPSRDIRLSAVTLGDFCVTGDILLINAATGSVETVVVV